MGGSRLSFAVAAGAILIALVWAGWLLVGGMQVQSGLDWAKRRIDAGQYRLARDKLVRVSAWWPRDAEVEALLALCEAELGRPHAALAAWARVPQGSPRPLSATLAMGRTLLRSLGRMRDAELCFSEVALGAGMAASEARWALTELLLWEGRLDEVRLLLKDIWRRGQGSDRAAALRELWRLESVIVASQEVQPILDLAARTAPDDDRVWLARARLASQYGRHDEARDWLERCERLRSDPTRSELLWRARLQWALAALDPQAARRALALAAPHSFTESERFSLRAWFAARRNDSSTEGAALEHVIAFEPGNTPALDRLVSLATEAGRTERAAELRKLRAERLADKNRYRRLVLSDRTRISQEELHERARLAERLGRWFEARGWLTLALDHDSGDHRARAGLERLASDARVRASELLAAAAPGVSLLELLGEAGGSISEARLGSTAGPAETFQRSAIDFRDDAQSAGLRFSYQNGETPQHQVPETIGGGVAVLDYDGDGWLDVYVVQGGSFPPRPENTAARRADGDRLFRNRRDGTFEDATANAGIAQLGRGYGFGVTSGDYNNDGWTDLLVTRYGSYLLLRNRGDGTFTDATASAGLCGARDWPTSAAFADLDGDGDLDLYVCHYLVWDDEHPTLCPDSRAPGGYASCLPLRFPARADHLFRNDGGHFVDVTAQAGIADRDGRGLGVVATDFDGDGRIDLFVANDMSANFLFHNLGKLKFEEIALEAGVACNGEGGYQAGMGVACGDLDGDGRPDLAVTNFFGESTTFFHNLGAGVFADGTAAVGLKAPSRFLLGFGITFLDADNDGCLDLASANGHIHDLRPKVPYAMPAQLLAGGPKGHLRDVSHQSGAAWGVPRIGRGLACADLDNDGRLDLLLVAQNSPMAYFHNRTEPAGHFLTIRLEGRTSSRDATGATVTINAGGRRHRAWRVGGGSYASANDPRLHFGLGPSETVDRIEVHWLSGRVDELQSLRADTGYLIREGEQRALPLNGFSARKPP
jgi:tetratricopeptide (TPR) repeat protein